MKEQLRIAIRTKGVLALTMLDEWLAWVQRCRIPAFVELGRKIKKNIAGIEAAMLNNLSNALIEAPTPSCASCTAWPSASASPST